MDDEEYSDSDVSDEDYRPEVSGVELPSEDDSDCDSDAIEEIEQSAKINRKDEKRIKKQNIRPNKKLKVKDDVNSESMDENKETKIEVKEDTKKRADSLWADFLKDTGTKPKPAETPSSSKTDTNSDKPVKSSPTIVKGSAPKDKVTITKIFEFAGEEVKVLKQVEADSAEARLLELPLAAIDKNASSSGKSGTRGGIAFRPKTGLSGLQSVLGQLGKKSKISTLEKSKLDWDGFKKNEGIEEEIQTHNRGKDGYLEKQDFLERTDLRQFEIEKRMRAHRSNR